MHILQCNFTFHYEERNRRFIMRKETVRNRNLFLQETEPMLENLSLLTTLIEPLFHYSYDNSLILHFSNISFSSCSNHLKFMLPV